jgi:hypothetical protein
VQELLIAHSPYLGAIVVTLAVLPVLLATEEGGLAHFDGQTWTFSDNPFRASAQALWLSAAGDVWAWADRGVEIHTPAH